jgi:hypothetical protein
VDENGGRTCELETGGTEAPTEEGAWLVVTAVEEDALLEDGATDELEAIVSELEWCDEELEAIKELDEDATLLFELCADDVDETTAEEDEDVGTTTGPSEKILTYLIFHFASANA